MKTLTLQDINPFNSGLKMLNTKSGRVITVNYSYIDNDEVYVVCKERSISYNLNIYPFKPILYHTSWLTKEIMLPGYDKPVVPIVELAKIAFPGFWKYNDASTAAESKLNLSSYVMFSFSYAEKSFNCTEVHNAELKTQEWYIPNQYQLFQKLAEWKFNFNGIPDELVEYVTEEFNPYLP